MVVSALGFHSFGSGSVPACVHTLPTLVALGVGGGKRSRNLQGKTSERSNRLRQQSPQHVAFKSPQHVIHDMWHSKSRNTWPSASGTQKLAKCDPRHAAAKRVHEPPGDSVAGEYVGYVLARWLVHWAAIFSERIRFRPAATLSLQIS